MTTTEHSAYLRAARLARARRRASSPELRGYPALGEEEKTEETLAAAPSEKGERRPKTTSES